MTPRRFLALHLSLLPTLASAAPPSEKVIERYKQMLVANPAEGTALDRLWQAYAEQGRTGDLIAEFQQKTDFAGQMLHGLLLKKAGRVEDASRALQHALTLDLNNPAPALALGRLEMSAGRNAQAAIWLAKAVELLPRGDAQKTAALIELGTVQLAAGNLNEAAAAWEKTVELAPGDLALRRQLADTYVRNNLGSRAIPHLEFIVQKGQPQERAQSLQQMAAIHQAQGEQDAAIRATERALTYTAPGNWLRGELQAQLIRLHQRYHRTAELEAKWVQYAEENPRDRGAYLQVIDFYERVGDRTQQLAWLEKLVQAAPKETEYRLRQARLLAEVDQLDRAATVYDGLLGSQPRNIELVFERARIDVQRDQVALAGERIRALVQKSGNDEGVRTKALEFYLANRLRDLAEKHLREDAQGRSSDAIVALANFLFSNHREAEARETLKTLVRETDSPAQQSAAYFRVADQLKAQNDIPAAIVAVRKAIDLNPGIRDYHFMLGELEAASGRYVAAEVAYESAFSSSKSPAEVLEADQRLYESLRNQKQPGEDESKTTLPRPDAAAAVTSAIAQGYLLKIQREAVDQPAEERWLRVARWQQWSRNTRMAADAAERALSLNPKSIAAHDFLAKLFAADPQSSGAQKHLRALMELDPANRTTYLRRLGQLLMQSGQIEDALNTFGQLVREVPGDLDSLSDLAAAQQRAERWNDALKSLQQLFALSPASRKREAAVSLLRVYERLAMREDAANLLLQRIDAEEDMKERFALFQDLLGLCSRYALLDWLRNQFQDRRKLRADDYFTEVALGRVLKAQGNKAAAFEVLSDAAFAAPNPAEALPDLVREAEELRRLDAAVQLQAHLVQVVTQTTPEALERLAQLQEKNLQPEEAAKTWNRIVSKFPRDVPALEKAADFERKWGNFDRSIELLRRLRSIEPNNAAILARLAELDIAAGNTHEAIDCLEGVLASTSAEKAGEPVRYPAVKPEDASRLEIAYRSTVQRRRGKASPDALRSLREFWQQKGGEVRTNDDLGKRLQAIRDLAEVIASRGEAAATSRWVERWQRPEHGPSERLWALHYIGASDALLDEIAKLAAANGGDTAVNAFIWLALEHSQFERLGAWLTDKKRTPADRDFFIVSLERYLQEGRAIVPPALVQKVFPEGYRARVWQAATAFAQRGHFWEAIQLGNRVYKQLTEPGAAYAVELARWQVNAGDLAGARQTLRAGWRGSGEGYSAPEYAALRAAYLLLPSSEKVTFVSEIEAELDEHRQPVHTALVRALLHGLAGREKEAREQLDRLLGLRAISPDFGDDRATAATRQWDFVLMAGSQLVAWHFDQLAAHLWRQALSDEAAVALQTQLPPPQGESIRARVHEVRTRLVAIDLMDARPEDVPDVITDYSRFAPPDGLIPLAETLEAMGGNPVAVVIYRRLWEREPSSPHALRNAVSACRTAGDWNTLEEILERVVTDGQFRVNDAAHRDLVQQYAEVLEQRQDFERARSALAEIAETGPLDPRLYLKLAHLQERCGQRAAAEATYRKLLSREPTNVAARLSLAALLDADGKTTGAIDLLERASGVEIDSRLAELNMKMGRREEALAAFERVPPPDHARVAQALADQFEAKGDSVRARNIIRAALARAVGEQASFPLQARLVRMLPADASRALIEREVKQLRRLTDEEGASTWEYYDLISGEAERLGLTAAFQAELAEAWNQGAGDLSAGIVLLRDGANPDVARTWEAIQRHQLLDATTLSRAALAFEARKDEPRRAEALERIARIEAEEPRRLMDWGRALAEQGRMEEARVCAEELMARSVFASEATAHAAELCAVIGDLEKSGELYARATAADPTVRTPEVHLAHARVLMKLGKFSAAHAALQKCSRNRSAALIPVAVEYLQATGTLEGGGAELADLQLAPAQWIELRRAVFGKLIAAGKTEPALALAEQYPQLVGEAESRQLRSVLKDAAAIGRAANLLEQLRMQGAAQLAAETAETFATWADAELASLQVDAAIAHLAKARELAPANWRISERLAGLHLDRADAAKATQTVQDFLAASTDAADREKAKQLLSRIPTS